MPKKQKYINEFLNLYKKYGVKSITVDDLALHLGISKKTIYKYFSSRDEIISLVVVETVNELESIMLQSYKKECDTLENLISIIVNLVIKISEYNPVFFYSLQKFYPSVIKLIDPLKTEYYNILNMLINNGIYNGIFRDTLDAKYMLQTHIGFFTLWINNPSENLLDNELNTKRFIYEIVNSVRGVTTIKGHKLLDDKADKIELLFKSQINI